MSPVLKTVLLASLASGAQTKLGDFTVSDLTVNGGHVYLGSNGTIRGSADRTEILGDAGSDDLYLLPGTILNSGRIALWGNSEMELRAGNGVIRLFNGSTGVQTAIFGNVGDLDIADDLTVGGDRIEFTSGGQLYNTPTLLSIYGNNPTGTTRLGAGTLTTHGSIEIAGQSYMRFEAGNGEFHFRNGMAAEERASLGANGDLQIDGDLTADGDHQYLGGGETTIYSGAGVTSIYGNAPSDLLRLVGGHDLNTSYIEIHGAGDIDFLTDSGSFRFRVADTDVEVASLNSSGDLRIDGGIDLTDGATIWTTGSPATLTFGGTNLDLYLGDSSADNARVPGNLYVTGTKDFVQNHPEREDLSIHYTALEGDESGTYTRGSGRLEGGVARVQLGETFAWVTNPDVGLTAQVTARGGEAPLWVESISTTDLVVRCDDARCADAAFDYVVQGLRIGYEDKPVVRPKRMEAAVPPPGYFAEERSVADAVGSRTALERFEREHRGVWGELPPTEERRAAELRAAIGVHAYGDAVRERLPGGGEEDGSPGFRSASATRTAGAETGLPDTVADPAGSGGASAIGEATVASTAPASELRARSFRSEMPAVATSVTVAVPVEPGTVLAIDPHRPGVLRIADSPEDPAVFGVTLGEAGLVLDTGGAFPSEEATTVESERFEVAVAVAGVARCRVDAGYGSIRPGDLLVASPTPGRAMRAADPVRGGRRFAGARSERDSANPAVCRT